MKGRVHHLYPFLMFSCISKKTDQFCFSLFMCMDCFCSEPRHLGHNILASFGLGCNQSCILNYLLSMTLFHFTALMLVQLLIMTSQITIVNRSSQSYLPMLHLSFGSTWNAY